MLETDKSKNFCVTTPNEYKNDMNIHIQEDKVVDQKYVNKVTKMFNETCKSLITILGIGENNGQYSRIMKNIVKFPFHVDFTKTTKMEENLEYL